MEQDYESIIKTCYKGINTIIKTREWKNDDKVLSIFNIYYSAIYSQIHSVLVPQQNKTAENQIRDILAKYVVGYLDTRKRTAYIGSLSPLKSKIEALNNLKRKNIDVINKYLDLYNNFMALAAFRSFKHFCLYLQPVFGFTLWQDTQNVFEGYWYYANRMVLDGSVKFLEKQLPTGFGKSISDCFMQSYIFGINIDDDALKVCGNDKFTDDCFQNVIKIMTSPQYAQVFPYYAKFNCDINSIFSVCSRKDLKFTINGSKKSTNLRIVTKLSDTNGVRAKWLFIDDITQRRDMSNLAQHDKDIHSFIHEWFERNYNRDLFFIVASGTTYSQFDILSWLRRVMGGDNAVISAVNKYTSVSKSDYIIENGVSIFVCVPLVDYDTDESTYPKKISTFSARKKREENPTEFWAMDMQKPLPPDDSPFYFTKLREYSSLPKVGECGRTEFCCAALDTKRRGTDYVSMPIFFEAEDSEMPDQNVFYLKDWLYDNRTMKECIPLIVSKIISNRITRLYVERNTEECIEMILQDKLREKGYTSCVIEEVYSTEQKDRRIMATEGDIKSRIIFPRYGLYAPSNDIGKALLNVYGYAYPPKKVPHDDAPDSLALFTKRFLMGGGLKYAEMTTFMR